MGFWQDLLSGYVDGSAEEPFVNQKLGLGTLRRRRRGTLLPIEVTRPAMTFSAPVSRATSGQIEIELPGEIRVRVQSQFDTVALVEVLTALQAR